MSLPQQVTQQVKSPSFWLSVGGGLAAIASGLTDTGNPTLIAIGGAIIAVHAIVEGALKAFQASSAGDTTTAAQQVGALAPILQEQIVNVQHLASKVEDQVKILGYKAKGYEVTPHVEPTVITPGPTTSSTDQLPGGAHHVIGGPTQ